MLVETPSLLITDDDSAFRETLRFVFEPKGFRTLLAGDGERTYLILAQNSDELRATGGFISATGVIRFREGALVDMKFADSLI